MFDGLRRFLGRTYRCGVVSIFASAAGDSAVGNGSSAFCSAGSRPMASACLEQYRSAISMAWCCRTGLKAVTKDYRGVPWSNSRIASATAFGVSRGGLCPILGKTRRSNGPAKNLPWCADACGGCTPSASPCKAIVGTAIWGCGARRCSMASTAGSPGA